MGIGQTIYQTDYPTGSLRSPFTGYPLSSSFPTLDTDTVILNMTNPRNSTGSIIDWVYQGFEYFKAQITVILYYVKFFTAGFIIDLLNSLGFPANLLYIITAPMALYVMHTTFVMITNRLGSGG